MDNSKIIVGGCRIPVTTNIADNLSEIKKAIDWAAENSVDILSTPECALSGYMWRPDSEEDPRVTELDSAIKEISEYSKEKKVDLVLGTAWYDKEKRWTNMQAFIINGKCEHTHRKYVLITKEMDFYHPGTMPTTYEYKGCKIAGLICNDFWSNPMIWPGSSAVMLDDLARLGTNILFVSSYVPKEPGPNRLFYKWHETCIEMYSAYGIWNTVICDTTTAIDGTLYDGESCVPCGVCDYATQWLTVPGSGTAYFKTGFQPDLKIAI